MNWFNSLKFSLVSLSLLIFTACGGSDSEFTTYEGDGYKIDISNNFDFQEGVDGETKLDGEVQFTAKSKGASSKFVASLYLVKINVEEDLKLKDFAENLYEEIIMSTENSDYVWEENEELDKSGGMYWGDYFMTTPEGIKTKVRQIYALESPVAYVLTANFSVNEEESIVKEIEEMLDSFELE